MYYKIVHLNTRMCTTCILSHYPSVLVLGKPDTYRKYVDEIFAFLYSYNPGSSDELVNCAEYTGTALQLTGYDRASCLFDLNVGGRCNANNEYGYGEGMPCFVLKLNRIYGWLPDPINNSSGVKVRCYGLTDTDKVRPSPRTHVYTYAACCSRSYTHVNVYCRNCWEMTSAIMTKMTTTSEISATKITAYLNLTIILISVTKTINRR